MVGYGLFCIAEVPIETLNKILYDAARPNNDSDTNRNDEGRPRQSSHRHFEFHFWLATQDWPGPGSWNHRQYEVDEKGRPDFTSSTAGYEEKSMAPTIPPIPENFRSPFIGKTVPELLQIMEHEADASGLVTEKFAVADQQTIEDGSILICHIDGNEESELGMSTIRVHPYVAAGVLVWLLKACVDDDDGPKSTEGIWLYSSRRDARRLE